MSNTDKLREIAKKYFPTEEKLSNNSLYNQLQQSSQDNLFSDLTALLEQHKEVIAADMYPKEFVLWKDAAFVSIAGVYFKKQDAAEVEFRNLSRFTIDELFDYWLKNHKK